jgi:hypothetical protein
VISGSPSQKIQIRYLEICSSRGTALKTLRAGVRHFPEEERMAAQAEMLDINAAIKSPSLRLWDAIWFRAVAGKSLRAFRSSAPKIPFRKMLLLGVMITISSLIQSCLDIYDMASAGTFDQQPSIAIDLAFGFLIQIVGGYFIWRAYRTERRVRRMFAAHENLRIFTIDKTD